MLNKNLYKANAQHVVRAYLLNKINTDLEMLRVVQDVYPYEPFLPSQQTREIAELPKGKPFVIYSVSTADNYPDWWQQVDTMQLSIYSDGDEDGRILRNYLATLLRRDYTVDELTQFSLNASSAVMRLFDFKRMQVLNVIGPEPVDQEGARALSVLTLRYEYTTDFDSNMMR